MRACSVARLTVAASMFGNLAKAFSTRPTQEAQVMPSMSIETKPRVSFGFVLIQGIIYWKIKKAKGNRMHTLFVSGMRCGGCIKAITRAVQMQDARATVQVDLNSQKVEIESRLDREALITIIADAGFPLAAS
jgi:copper chaperone